jgi:hypothetical protein
MLRGMFRKQHRSVKNWLTLSFMNLQLVTKTLKLAFILIIRSTTIIATQANLHIDLLQILYI